ncbi:MAG: hypothetical protein KBT36_13875 [Kurthia sp.]|nr:hypothetical protein [Candidatus Kurthia equi]
MDSNPIKALKRITSKLVPEKKEALETIEPKGLPTIQLTESDLKRKTEEIKQYSSEEEIRIRNRFANILASEEDNTEDAELLKPVEKIEESEPGEDYYIHAEDSEETPLLTKPLKIPPIQMQKEFERTSEAVVTTQLHINESYIDENIENADELQESMICLHPTSNKHHDEPEDNEEWMRRIEEEEERLEMESTIVIKLETSE